MSDRIYACIDLKSFYASVECVERGMDPLTTNLVVADPERTDKTICLAVSPSMKALGVPNRCRVFQIPDSIDYYMAPPRMQKYIDYSAEIYGIYLKYIAKEDIHVYSIDEVFMDVTDYLHIYDMSARQLIITIMEDVYQSMGITATAGIGTNLYLAKVALDITAKHVEDHIGILDEETYCRTLWNHKPLTDFWRIGSGIAASLERYGILTMGDIARADENLLYKLFGIDAELLIDHAWGRETTTMEDIKNYIPKNNCICSGQVFSRDYDHEEGKLAVKEMADLLCLDLVEKGMMTESITLHMRYSRLYRKESVNATVHLMSPTNSARRIVPQIEALYERTKDRKVPIRRVTLSCNRIISEKFIQYDLFTNPADLEKERKMQKAILSIKKKFGKNAILKGMDLLEGATTIERNQQIGGHKSG